MPPFSPPSNRFGCPESSALISAPTPFCLLYPPVWAPVFRAIRPSFALSFLFLAMVFAFVVRRCLLESAGCSSFFFPFLNGRAFFLPPFALWIFLFSLPPYFPSFSGFFSGDCPAKGSRPSPSFGPHNQFLFLAFPWSISNSTIISYFSLRSFVNL